MPGNTLRMSQINLDSIKFRVLKVRGMKLFLLKQWWKSILNIAKNCVASVQIFFNLLFYFVHVYM